MMIMMTMTMTIIIYIDYKTYMQSEGSDLFAANFSLKVFTQAFASLLKEGGHGEPINGGIVGTSSPPSEHNSSLFKF